MTRILLARPDHLGDVVLALPAARSIAEAIPGARVDALVAEPLAAIARRCPWIDAVVSAPFPAPTAADDPPGWGDVVATIAPALAGRYDGALLPRIDDPWSGSLVAAAGVPVRIGYDHPRTARFLTAALPVADRRHVTRLAGDLVAPVAAALGFGRARVGDPSLDPWLVPDDADRDEARSLLPEHGVDPDRYVVLHPGAGWPLKVWRPERWGAVARHVAGRFGLPVVVTGGAAERGLVADVVAASAGTAVGLAGELSLGGLLALLGGARLVAGVDSGPLQVAAAAGAPVVALFGPADPAEFAPWAPSRRLEVVRVDLPCSPCRSLDAPPCGARVFPACVDALSVARLTGAVDRLLG